MGENFEDSFYGLGGGVDSVVSPLLFPSDLELSGLFTDYAPFSGASFVPRVSPVAYTLDETSLTLFAGGEAGFSLGPVYKICEECDEHDPYMLKISPLHWIHAKEDSPAAYIKPRIESELRLLESVMADSRQSVSGEGEALGTDYAKLPTCSHLPTPVVHKEPLLAWLGRDISLGFWSPTHQFGYDAVMDFLFTRKPHSPHLAALDFTSTNVHEAVTITGVSDRDVREARLEAINQVVRQLKRQGADLSTLRLTSASKGEVVREAIQSTTLALENYLPAVSLIIVCLALGICGFLHFLGIWRFGKPSH